MFGEIICFGCWRAIGTGGQPSHALCDVVRLVALRLLPSDDLGSWSTNCHKNVMLMVVNGGKMQTKAE